MFSRQTGRATYKCGKTDVNSEVDWISARDTEPREV